LEKINYSIASNGQENHPFIKKFSTKIFGSLSEFDDWALKNLKLP